MTHLLAETNVLEIALPLVGSMLLCYGIYQVIVETRKGEPEAAKPKAEATGKKSSGT